jgi:hypothetical protein
LLIDIETYELMNEAEFTEHEKVIEKGKRTFAEVGKALSEIRERKGYRLQYGTFEEYCLKRWGWSVRTGYNMMAASRVIDNIQQTENVRTFAQIDYSKAVSLSSLTTEEQIVFVKEHDVYQMTKRELDRELKAKKEAESKTIEAEYRATEAQAEVQRLNKELSEMPEPQTIEVEVIPLEIQEKASNAEFLKKTVERLSQQNSDMKLQLSSAKTSTDDTMDLATKVDRFTWRINQFLGEMGSLAYVGGRYMRSTEYSRLAYDKALSNMEKWIHEVRESMQGSRYDVKNEGEVIDIE